MPNEINILKDSVARRIAAGEVIDRPGACIRELMDNSIDAKADEITLSIKNGGIDEIRLVDNGIGMDERNLRLCFLPHATSKINDFEDIYKTNTLGFRGEALSSIAACSKLTIISSTSDSLAAHKLEIRNGKIIDLSDYRGSKGTVISVRDIFYSMPGRKNFLKSPSAESAVCKTMFIEKALPQSNKSFKYFTNDKLSLYISEADLVSRVKSAYSSLFHNELLYNIEKEIDGILIKAAAGKHSLYRKDRKYIHIFINNRRVNDLSLVHAVDYAYSQYLPGGCHPVCFLFLEIPPEHIDFNIHPAKREVKFRNLPSIHHCVTQALGEFLSTHNSFKSSFVTPKKDTSYQTEFEIKQETTPTSFHQNYPVYYKTYSQPEPVKESIFKTDSIDNINANFIKPEINKSTSLIYLGQLFKLFLLFEHGDEFLLIDQHAAHERLIFNDLISSPKKVQELLVPMELRLEKKQEISVEDNLEVYSELGFELQKISQGNWCINALPPVCSGMEDDITDFFMDEIKDAAELKKRLYAMMSCRSAIKDGDIVDSISALEIATKVLELDNPRCPHGRPIIQIISRDKLFEMFGRTF
ncbi:MAG: DNA mismatch repair endonuclease MutL [Spirochaetales bacterium]|nr:DNA mismatch repair endonuclease MutL [Spirochaetales bacterium]